MRMSDNASHLDQLFQRTEADITILRTQQLSTDSVSRSTQTVERQAVEAARSLSRIRTQLESLAKEVRATSASVDMAKSTKSHLATTTSQGPGYVSGQSTSNSPVLPLSTLKEFFHTLESICALQEKTIPAPYHHQHSSVRVVRAAYDVAQLEPGTFQVYVDKISEQLRQTPDVD